MTKTKIQTEKKIQKNGRLSEKRASREKPIFV
jgi:hypothetical protein